MGSPSLRTLADSIRTERDRYRDLKIRWLAQNDKGEVIDGAEQLIEVGGCWDAAVKKWDKRKAENWLEFSFHTGQLEGARWLCRWFRAKCKREDLREGGRPIFSALFHGGRRAGKTDLAVKAAITYAVMRPLSQVWLISETVPKTEELEGKVRGWLPMAWYDHIGSPWHKFTLAHGSVIWLRSSHDPQSLKRGVCDFAVLNEAQQMDEDAFAIVRAATADNGGLTVLAANPWTNPIGAWSETFFEEARAGTRPAREFWFDAFRNPHVNLESLEAMKYELDERTYRREILGEYLAREDVVFHAWSNASGIGNIRPMPQMGECTREFSKRIFGRPYDAILGLDFQKIPHVCAVSIKAFVDPEAPRGGEPLLWYDDEIVLKDGLEEDLSRELFARGYDPARTVLVCDASGAWQDEERVKGRGSFDILRSLGWIHLYKPDPKSEKNPDVVERVKVANSLMRDATGKRRLFSRPELLELNQALKCWETVSVGVPYKKSKHSHLGDAATYPLFRFYPRRRSRSRGAQDAAGVRMIDVKPRGPKIF